AGITDPAERVAASSRQTMRILSHRPGLAKLLFDSGMSTTPVLEGLRARIGADIRRGLDAGRFEVDDLGLVVSAAAGLGLGVAIDVYEGRLPGDAAEGVAALILSMLGVPDDEARTLLSRPLPDHEMPEPPLSSVNPSGPAGA
ncbi:MAG: hypothetical protein AAF602_07635, partial [Myxococcota bacterium]